MRKFICTVIIVMAASISCEQQSKSHDRRAKFVCQQNLRQLYTALQQYAKAHQGRIPDSWNVLVASGILVIPSGADAVNPLVCPGSTIEASRLPSSQEEWQSWIQRGDVSYLLVAGGKPLAGREIIVVERSGDHLDGGFVLFSDGSIELRSDNDLNSLTPK